MSSAFVSIKEASDKYQKAEITIRRLVRQVVSKKKHKDRLLIRPSVTQVEKLKKQKKPFSYSINTKLLEKTYGDIIEAAKDAVLPKGDPIQKKKDEKERQEGIEEVFKMANAQLENQLKVKDDQIRALNQALDDLSERQRETNILMKGLQEKLLIEAPKKRRWWRL
jgi:chromosome segregation ATPase